MVHVNAAEWKDQVDLHVQRGCDGRCGLRHWKDVAIFKLAEAAGRDRRVEGRIRFCEALAELDELVLSDVICRSKVLDAIWISALHSRRLSRGHGPEFNGRVSNSLKVKRYGPFRFDWDR